MKLDPHDMNAGTGVGGRMLDMLKKNGYQTSGNTVDGSSPLNVGDSFYSNPTSTVSTGDFQLIDEYSSLGPNEMLELVKSLNGVGKSGNSMFGETWSDRLSQTFSEYEIAMKIDEAIKNGDFNMNDYPKGKFGLPGNQLRAIAQYMKSRHFRKVDREVHVVVQSGFDMHAGQHQLPWKFAEANGALSHFIAELKRQGTWQDTVILMGSDFGRSVTPNSNGGTDHAWGGK